VLRRRASAQTTGSMADTSLLVNKRPGSSKTHRQGRVLPVMVVSSSTNLHAAEPLAKRLLPNPTMDDSMGRTMLQPQTLHLDLARLTGLLEELVATLLHRDRTCTGGTSQQRLRLRQPGHREISLVAMNNRHSVIDRHQLHSPLLQRLMAHPCTHHVWPSLNRRQFRRTTLPTADHTTLYHPRDLLRVRDQTDCQQAPLLVLHLRVARHLDRLDPNASVVTVSEPT
jgi:hypothetical protein